MKKRWAGTITYEDAGGHERAIRVCFDEIRELGEILEAGPSFTRIKDVRFWYALGTKQNEEDIQPDWLNGWNRLHRLVEEKYGCETE